MIYQINTDDIMLQISMNAILSLIEGFRNMNMTVIRSVPTLMVVTNVHVGQDTHFNMMEKPVWVSQ